MNDQNQQEKIETWRKLLSNIATGIIIGLAGIGTYLWIANQREADVSILASQMLELKESLMAGFAAAEKNTNSRFEAIDTRFETIETIVRFDAIDERFDAAEKNTNMRFDAIDARLDDLIPRIELLEKGLKTLEGAVSTGFRKFAVELSEIRSRLLALEGLKLDVENVEDQLTQIEKDFNFLSGKIDTALSNDKQE